MVHEMQPPVFPQNGETDGQRKKPHYDLIGQGNVHLPDQA